MAFRRMLVAAIVLPLVPCLSPYARAGSISGASITVTSVFNGQSPQQFTFSNITSTRIDRGVFSPWMPGASSTQFEFIPGTPNGDQTRNELDVDFDGSSAGYQFQPGQTLDLTFQLNNNLEFDPFAALTVANDVQVPSASINGGTLTVDMTDLDQIDGNGGQLQYIFDVETMPQFPFSLDDQNVISGGTSTEPTFSTLTNDGYTDVAGFLGLSNDEVNVHGDGVGHDQSVFMPVVIPIPVFNGFTYSYDYYNLTPRVTFQYAGFANHSTMDVLLKFMNSSGSDPITGQALTDLVNYINYNNDGTLTAYAYNGDPGDAFPILDSDAAGFDAGYGISGPNWDILLQDNNVEGDPLADLDFSQFSDSSVAAGSFYVAEVGVVPEPASLSLMALGAAGLLIRGRRKKV
ncbi:MAG TPA: PEP-CTERM sorting domain-containing protein [Phycisphaerae bacterium]|nr:PEP-CTERM sorting domain-containing protein [Phycisphaerae bacterium]